jgi:hypothetical protein
MAGMVGIELLALLVWVHCAFWTVVLLCTCNKCLFGSVGNIAGKDGKMCQTNPSTHTMLIPTIPACSRGLMRCHMQGWKNCWCASLTEEGLNPLNFGTGM